MILLCKLYIGTSIASTRIVVTFEPVSGKIETFERRLQNEQFYRVAYSYDIYIWFVSVSFLGGRSGIPTGIHGYI